MGSGKSTVGSALAERLGRRFVDTDAEIERLEGRSVAEIFARDGEAAFRALERAQIERWCDEPAVVALGGGAVAQPGVAERLSKSGTVVYLRARPETLLERVGEGAGRPLLAGLSKAERLARLGEILAERAPAYEKASVVVDGDGLAAGEVVERVAARLGEVRE